jgi:hypothetical protein
MKICDKVQKHYSCHGKIFTYAVTAGYLTLSQFKFTLNSQMASSDGEVLLRLHNLMFSLNVISY